MSSDVSDRTRFPGTSFLLPIGAVLGFGFLLGGGFVIATGFLLTSYFEWQTTGLFLTFGVGSSVAGIWLLNRVRDRMFEDQYSKL